MNKRDDFDDRSKNPHEDRQEDKGGSDNDDYNRKGDDSFSEMPDDGAHSQQQENTDETIRIENLKKG